MEMKHLVSIIIPVYQVEDYLVRCLKSIERQTYTNIEIIVVDDGASDRCPEIIDERAKNDNRYKVIHQKNQGPVASRNNGLNIATGDLIAFVDGDDFAMPSMIETLVLGMEKYDADLSIVEAVNDESDARENGNSVLLTQEETFRGIFSGRRNLRVTVWNKLYKQEIIGNLRFEQEAALAEDILFVAQYMKKSRKIAFTDAKVYIYEIREGSIIHGGSKEKLIIEKPLIDQKIVKEVENTIPTLRPMMLNWAISDCIAWRGKLKSKYALIRFIRKSLSLRMCVFNAEKMHWKTKILFFIGLI